jgi:ATP-dependent RNA helicase SUPV3L1/SUV3
LNKRAISDSEEINHCAVIYGALPPETKKTQAYMFNNRLGDIKFLVATDAVGMGLNLNIQRVIFSTIEKNHRLKGKAKIDEYSVKQIGGRAGRYT